MFYVEGFDMDNLSELFLSGPNWMKLRLFQSGLIYSNQMFLETELRKQVMADVEINNLLDQLVTWPKPVLKRHNDADHLIHKLSFLAELGLSYEDDPRLKIVLDKIRDNLSDEGYPQVLTNIGKGYGGSGKDELAWMLCDTPLLLFILKKFNTPFCENIFSNAFNQLSLLVRENGFPCAVSPLLGKFRGPGRKDDPCPYTNLLILKLVTLFPNEYNKPFVQFSITSLLDLWEERKNKKPYLFAMGSGFEKIKLPFIWFDIFHTVQVLSYFPLARQDQRFVEMAKLLFLKADSDGKFQPESIWRAWRDWEFGQKKETSIWMTFNVYQIKHRLAV